MTPPDPVPPSTLDSTRSRHARGRVVGVLGRLLARALIAVFAALGLLAVASPASAHAVLVRSSPEDGSRLERSPASVVLDFDESVQLVPGTARVIAASGDRADTGADTGERGDTGGARLGASGTEIVIPLRPALPRGSYTVTWRVVSADSHLVSGSIAFGVGQDAAAAAGAGATTAKADALDAVASAAQGLGYLGLALLAGLPGVAAVLWPEALRLRRIRALVIIGGAAVIIGAAAQLALQGPRATGSGWSGVLHLDDLGQTLASLGGTALAARILLAAVALALTVVGTRRPRIGAGFRIAWLATALALLVTVALVGHAAVGADAALAVPAAALHLAAMAVWLGGLAGLGVCVLPRMRTAAGPDPRALRRWSLTAFVAVGVLVVTGEYQAWRQVRPVEALWQTDYGVTLLLKLGVVLVALAAAALAQRVVGGRAGGPGESDTVPDAERDAVRETPLAAPRETQSETPRVAPRIRRAVAIETVALIAVIAVTTVLVGEPPATQSFGPPAALSAPLGPDTLRVEVADTHRGPQSITATPVDTTGRVERLQALSATLSSADAGVAAINVRFRQDADGSWRSENATAPLPGVWTLSFDVSLSQAEGYATAASYRVW